MGEARRRRLAGLTPIEGYRCPFNHVAISVDIAGIQPATLAIRADKVTPLVAETDAMLTRNGIGYERAVRMFVATFKRLKAGDETMREPCLLAFWLVTHHPKFGAILRHGISRDLRRHGRTHVTLHVGADCGVAIALHDGFVDLEAALKSAHQAGTGQVGLVGEDMLTPETFHS